ncbi:MAG: hypothetical protein HUU15_17140, partial [Candidatus Brocadiae bacterium]|nr:hypothetical protein [Candidatus Brocadiia bacterium]
AAPEGAAAIARALRDSGDGELAMALEKAQVEVGAGSVSVRVNEVLRGYLDLNRGRLEAGAERALGRKVAVRIEAGGPAAPAAPVQKKNHELDPAVRRVIDRFDARVLRVDEPGKP